MAAATGFSSGRAAGNMLRSRGDWRLAALQGMAAGLPSLSEAQLGAAMVAAVKLELQPPVQWVQVRGKRGCGYHSAVGPPGSIGGGSCCRAAFAIGGSPVCNAHSSICR